MSLLSAAPRQSLDPDGSVIEHLQDYIWSLVWYKDHPWITKDSLGNEYTFYKGERVIYPKQLEWWEATHIYKATLYGGSGGSGKSHMGRWIVAAYLTELAMQGHPRARGVIFCETFKDVEDRHVQEIVENEALPAWLGTYNAKRNEFKAHDEFGGWKIVFRNTENFEKYRSVRFAIAFIDESTEHSEEFFNFILTRLRWATNGVPVEHCPLILATNPAGPGVAWNKRRFVDPETRDKEFYDEELKVTRKGFHFIQALPTDNPALSDDVLIEMKNKPEKLRDAYFYGLWTVMDGQFFDLDEEIHFIRPFEIPPTWNLTFAIDWGYSHPFHALVLATDPVSGDMYVINECSQVRWTVTQAKREIFKKFRHGKIGKDGYPDGTPYKYTFAVADPKMWSTDGSPDLNRTPAEVFNMKDDELPSFNIVPADNDRIPGWMALREVLSYEFESTKDQYGYTKRVPKSKPKLRFFRTCPLTYRSMMYCQHAKANSEDVEKVKSSVLPGEGDDGADDVRYAVMAAYKGSFRDSGTHYREIPNEERLLKSPRGSIISPYTNQPYADSTIWAD